ncbi:hypothetical protein [Ruminiclostridium cellobioparum]|uniref:hypothetical protein n=1 Tax=Ruminiclostridium cellobioparum TaxID=29355 RepID=UPI0004859946|nr:hypothetical protein [Ruminiclostridium cellobioparum]
MRRLGIQDFLIFALVLVLMTGSKQDAFVKAQLEFNNEYFELCDSVITDTREISREKVYEMAQKLQSDDCAQKLKKLKELLIVMEQNQNIKDSYSFSYGVSYSEYDDIVMIKESYKIWDKLSDDQRTDIARKYGIIVTTYSMEKDDRIKK